MQQQPWLREVPTASWSVLDIRKRTETAKPSRLKVTSPMLRFRSSAPLVRNHVPKMSNVKGARAKLS